MSFYVFGDIAYVFFVIEDWSDSNILVVQSLQIATDELGRDF